ncbi:MAG: ATP-binding protein [Clostridia bacterium]|nr:ATP-binding protein [Clostridia bacterium]
MQTLTVEAALENLEQATAFVDAFLEARDCPMRTQMQIDLCVEEIFVNIAHYAYQGKTGTAEIRLSEADGIVELTFLDSGMPYDPLKKEDPDVTLSAEKRQIGGLGIFLVKKSMDSVSYRFENGQNILTMTKAI